MGYYYHHKKTATTVLLRQHKVKQILQCGMTNHQKTNLPVFSFKWRHKKKRAIRTHNTTVNTSEVFTLMVGGAMAKYLSPLW